MRRPTMVPVVLGLMIVAATCHTEGAVVDCLDNPARPPTVVVGPEAVKWPADHLALPDGTPVDARARRFDGSGSVGSKIQYRADEARGLCIVGGDFFTTEDTETASWSDVWHHRWGFIVNTPSATIIGAHLYNTGDGIMFEGPTPTNWTIIGVRADGPKDSAGAFIHDDCIENDGMHSGRIIDSKFDGCASFLSAILDRDLGADRPDASANSILVQETLVRLQPMRNSYDPATYGEFRHGGFFKFSGSEKGDSLGDGTPPQLVLRSSIFRSDDPAAFGGNDGGKLGVPPGTQCTDVTIVGWETWPVAELATWVTACGAELHKGSALDWDVAVATWDASHLTL